MATYKLYNSSGSAVADIGSTLPTATVRACSKINIEAGASNMRPFYCYEFTAGGTYYYANIAGVNGTLSGLSCNTELNRTIKAPYAFSANGQSTDNSTFGVTAGTTLYLYGTTSTVVAQSLNITSGMTVYDASGNAYIVGSAYTYTITVVTSAVDKKQVGNIAICDSSGTVLAGNKTTTQSGTATYSYTFTGQSSSTTFKIVATAAVASYTNAKTWHQKYFFNGLAANNATIADGDISFTANTATYTANISSDTTFVCSYGAKYGVTISHGTGVKSSKISYSRQHSTGSYVTTSTSPISLSGTGTLYVEKGSTLSLSASASSGYVFSFFDGFVSQTNGVSSLNGNNSSSISGTILSISKAASFKVTASTYSISVSIADSNKASWGSVYIDSSGTTSKTLTAGTTYNFYFTSSTDSTYAPTISAWYVNGTRISGSSYTSDTVSGNVSVTCELAQNAWPIGVSAGSNGSVSISGRYNKTTGASLSTGYLYSDGRDYTVISVTPNAHYEVSAISKSDNLVAYSNGGTYAYSASSSGNSSLVFTFALAECVVKVSTNNQTLCTVSQSGTTIRFDSTNFITVYCQLKDAAIDSYRVDYWTIGGVARTDFESGGNGQYYFQVGATDAKGKAELLCVPHLVSTLNTLTITKSGSTSFAAAFVQVGSSVEESVSGDSWSQKVKENTTILARAVPTFGGKVSKITPTGISTYDLDESRLSFTMPASDTSVDFVIAEKCKMTLSLCVSNSTDPTVPVGKITLTSVNSSSVYTEVDTSTVQSVQVYESTSYTLTADDSDATYTFSGWYLNDIEFKSSELSIDISLTGAAKYTAVYVMRQTGTISIQYGLKSGDDVTTVELPETSQSFGLTITTTPDQTNPDKWVCGNSKSIAFLVTAGNSVEDDVQYEWTPVRVEVKAAIRDDTYQTVWSYDALNPEALTGTFIMRDNMDVRLLFVKVQKEGYGLVQALFIDGATNAMGTLSIFATEMSGYYSLGGVAEAFCYVRRKVVLAAAPKPGYSFAGWFKKSNGAFVPIASNGAVLTINTVTAGGGAYYASFASSNATVKRWNDGDSAKTFLWRSKVYVGAFYHTLRNVRVYSDAYPVKVTVFTATSPNEVFHEAAKRVTLIITSQSSRMFPPFIRDKYFAFSIEGVARVNHIALASSMEALK